MLHIQCLAACQGTKQSVYPGAYYYYLGVYHVAKKKARLECASRKLRSELFMRQSIFGCCALMPAAFFLVWMLPSLGRKIDAASGRAAFFVIQGEDVLML